VKTRRFPHLAHVARTLLSAQATSAASERVFSTTGFIMSVVRSSLSPDMLELCALVKSAVKNGIDLRAEVGHLKTARKLAANKRRTAAMAAWHAAKRVKGNDGAIIGGAGTEEAEEDDAVAIEGSEEAGHEPTEAEDVVLKALALVDGDGDDL
jgi:hypothetical protein